MALTAKESRQARIDSARAEVDRLLAIVTQQPVKAGLADTVRDIEEATRLLALPEVDTHQSILERVDSIVESAEIEIGMIRLWVERFGPDFRTLG